MPTITAPCLKKFHPKGDIYNCYSKAYHICPIYYNVSKSNTLFRNVLARDCFAQYELINYL